MKWGLTIATAAVLMLGGAARGQFQPSYPPTYQPSSIPQTLNTWYTHYLGRNVDQAGMDFWGPRLGSQNPPDVLAGILASDEYLNRNGGAPEGLVLGLYRDVLGRSPAQLRPQDVDYWVNKMNQYGSREAMIAEFLHDANTNIFTPPAALPVPMMPAPAYTPPVQQYTPPVPTPWNWRNPQHEQREWERLRRAPYRYIPYPH